MSFIDLLDDESERQRLNSYIDWNGIDSKEEFRKRVNEAFGTKFGKSLLNSMRPNDFDKWYQAEKKLIMNQMKADKMPKDEMRSQRRYYTGFVKGKAVGIVRHEVIEILRAGKPMKIDRYRDMKGRFTAIEGETKRDKRGKFVSKTEPPKDVIGDLRVPKGADLK